MIDKTLRAYRFYCWLNVVWYVLIGSFGMGCFIFGGQLSIDIDGVSVERVTLLRNSGLILAIIGLVFGVGSVLLMRQRSTEKTWLFHFLNICLGITTCCLSPFCIWLAIRWNSKEIKDYFARAKFEL
jgi:hypothetical protein